MLGKKLIGLGILGIGLTYAINVPNEFVDAYKQGKEDEKTEIVKEIKDLKSVIEGTLKFRYYLLAGKIPPPIVVEEKKLVSTPSGMKAVKKIRIYFPDDIDFSQLEQVKVELTKDTIPNVGWWIYIDVSKYPDYAIGYLKLQLKKLNYSPKQVGNWLVAGIYKNEGDAKANAKRLNQILHEKGILSRDEKFEYIKVEE
jgi:hypothetical protein